MMIGHAPGAGSIWSVKTWGRYFAVYKIHQPGGVGMRKKDRDRVKALEKRLDAMEREIDELFEKARLRYRRIALQTLRRKCDFVNMPDLDRCSFCGHDRNIIIIDEDDGL
jgi:hypothetical protein